MRKFHAAAVIISIVAGLSANAQTPAAASSVWDDPANWKSVQPSVTEMNIVYATVPLVHNPSAEASQTPGAVRKPMPTSGIATCDRSVTTRTCAWAEMPTPPPKTMPSMNATTGLG